MLGAVVFKREKAFGFDKKMKKNVGDTNNNPLCSIVIVIKKQMLFRQKELSPQLKERLKEYVYDVIGHLFKVYKELPCGFPEYIYQDALGIEFTENSVPFKKEYIFHPLFRGKPLMSYFKMDFMLERSRGNIIIECKAIDEIGEKERHQLFSYMSGSQFPIGILVNFSTYPKAEIEKYYYDKLDGTISPF